MGSREDMELPKPQHFVPMSPAEFEEALARVTMCKDPQKIQEIQDALELPEHLPPDYFKDMPMVKIQAVLGKLAQRSKERRVDMLRQRQQELEEIRKLKNQILAAAAMFGPDDAELESDQQGS